MRRTYLEMCIEVLQTIKSIKDIQQTRLMYSCNLSWKPLIEILKRLEGNGLITATIPENTTRKQLSLTPKGSIALEGYLKAMEQLKFLNPSKEEGM